MEELINYQPDLFVIYTGHNEFLEERTYRQIRELPWIVPATISLMARTRTWSAMTQILKSVGIYPEAARGGRSSLAVEVDAILDKSVGLDGYTRDDPLKKNILQHCRVSLERMADMARSVNARVIFVTPGSNLKDCSPFKSEHTGGLDPLERQRSVKMLARAKEKIQLESWDEALNLLTAAVALDPRHAELHVKQLKRKIYKIYFFIQLVKVRWNFSHES